MTLAEMNVLPRYRAEEELLKGLLEYEAKELSGEPEDKDGKRKK